MARELSEFEKRIERNRREKLAYLESLNILEIKDEIKEELRAARKSRPKPQKEDKIIEPRKSLRTNRTAINLSEKAIIGRVYGVEPKKPRVQRVLGREESERLLRKKKERQITRSEGFKFFMEEFRMDHIGLFNLVKMRDEAIKEWKRMDKREKEEYFQKAGCEEMALDDQDRSSSDEESDVESKPSLKHLNGFQCFLEEFREENTGKIRAPKMLDEAKREWGNLDETKKEEYYQKAESQKEVFEVESEFTPSVESSSQLIKQEGGLESRIVADDTIDCF